MTALPVIAHYEAADEAAVIALWQECGLTVPWNDPAKDITAALNTGHGQLFVARIDGTVVGAVMVGHDGHRGWIYYLAVTPDLRGQNLGKQLVAVCEEWVASRGIPKIQLMIRRSNDHVHSFYGSVGYEESDVVVMQRWVLPKANEAE